MVVLKRSVCVGEGVQFCPQKTFVSVYRQFLVVTTEGDAAGMLLTILQCTGQPPTTKSYRLQKVNSAKEPCVSVTAGHSAGQRTRGRDEVAQDEAG